LYPSFVEDEAQRDGVGNILDALSYISHPQSVQVTSPTRPGVTIEASQQILIEALPPILVLHLKRFLYDTNANGVVKISKTVEFSPELEIANGEYAHKGFSAASVYLILFFFALQI